MEKQVWIPRKNDPVKKVLPKQDKKVAEVQSVNAPRIAENEKWNEVGMKLDLLEELLFLSPRVERVSIGLTLFICWQGLMTILKQERQEVQVLFQIPCRKLLNMLCLRRMKIFYSIKEKEKWE
jgi:hypothetical protein